MEEVGLILADSLSSINNDFKLTLEIAGKTILERCIESMIQHVSRIVVVCGGKEEIIRKIVTRYYHVETVFNPNDKQDMIESIKSGLKDVTTSRVFIIPGDFPLVKKKTYEDLLNHKGNMIIPTFKGEKGYPILINKDIILDTKMIRMEDILDKTPQTLIEVDDAGILVDIDTIEDYLCIYRTFNQ
ncbi:NTP transferase domain-containing protein [Mycoplasmatota bacterium]|nr:NTP transferase domain-containing protein [Mycoplasmatota bacterium]